MVRKRQKRGQLVWDTMFPWIIGIVVLLLVGGLYFTLSGKGTSLIDYIKQVLRFGA